MNSNEEKPIISLGNENNSPNQEKLDEENTNGNINQSRKIIIHSQIIIKVPEAKANSQVTETSAEIENNINKDEDKPLDKNKPSVLDQSNEGMEITEASAEDNKQKDVDPDQQKINVEVSASKQDVDIVNKNDEISQMNETKEDESSTSEYSTDEHNIIKLEEHHPHLGNNKSTKEDKEPKEQIKIENISDTYTNINIKNTSLGLLQSQYIDCSSDSETESKENEDDNQSNSSDSEPIIVKDQDYREKVVVINSDSESSSSGSDVEITHENIRKKITEFEGNEEDMDDDDEDSVKKRKDPLRVRGELLLHELPPIQDLQITVSEEECVELGKIHSIVEQLVLVDSLPGTVPLNLETVLFIDKGQKVLGEVFDVIGPVTSPLYCVRFNSNKQITEKGIEIGQIVYVAPRTEYTHFIIVSDLLKNRGSDASWLDDIEPNQNHLDFSDDEEERNHRRNRNTKDHNNRSDDNQEQNKRTRRLSTSSQISDTSSIISNISEFNPQVRPGRGRGNFNQHRMPNRNQFRPRNQPLYNNPRLQNPPSYNYNQQSNSWHANYNFGYNQQANYNNTGSQYRPNYLNSQQTQYMNNLYNQSGTAAPGSDYQQYGIENNNMSSNTSNSVLPNPFAFRTPYSVPPQQQVNFYSQPPPPPPPPGSE